MADFEQHKITIHPGINDIPIPPTETEGSNISHMHEQFNNLIDSVVTGNEELQGTINYNYDYFYDYCYSNKELIDNNAVTISSNRNYHENITNTIQTEFAELIARVEHLENTLLPQSLFVFENITLSSDGNGNYKYDVTIPKTGNLLNILINDTWNGNSWSFAVNNAGISTSTGNSNDNAYIYAYDVGIYDQNVTENQTLTITSTNNDTAINKIRLKITPSDTQQNNNDNVINNLTDRITQLENTIAVIQSTLNGDNSEFIINGISLVNNNGYEEYLLTIPKTGTLTKIEFNDVNQLSEVYIEYSGSDLTTTENLGEDENYPYVLDFDPTITVNDQDTLRIYTEYEELTLTSIKLTIV